MRVRNLTINELKIIKLMMFEQGKEITTQELTRQFLNSKVAKVLEDDVIEGFVLVKDLAGLNEITQWHLKKEHAPVLKAMIKELDGPLATHERVNDKERISILESAGFKQISRADGILKDEKVTILRRD